MVVWKAPSLQTSSCTKATRESSGETIIPIMSREHPATSLPGTFCATVGLAVGDSAVPSQQAANANWETFNRNMLPLDVIVAAKTSISPLRLTMLLSCRKEIHPNCPLRCQSSPGRKTVNNESDRI